MVLTPAQELNLRIANDSRNIDWLANGGGFAYEKVQQVVTDCAIRLVQAKELDAKVGGNEFERKAWFNLVTVVKLYTANGGTT